MKSFQKKKKERKEKRVGHLAGTNEGGAFSLCMQTTYQSILPHPHAAGDRSRLTLK